MVTILAGANSDFPAFLGRANYFLALPESLGVNLGSSYLLGFNDDEHRNDTHLLGGDFLVVQHLAQRGHDRLAGRVVAVFLAVDGHLLGGEEAEFGDVVALADLGVGDEGVDDGAGGGGAVESEQQPSTDGCTGAADAGDERKRLRKTREDAVEECDPLEWPLATTKPLRETEQRGTREHGSGNDQRAAQRAVDQV